MKECSAYCRPDENVHVVLHWFDVSDKRPYPAIGSIGHVCEDWSCLPLGSYVRVLAIEPAREAKKPDYIGKEFDEPILMTHVIISKEEACDT